MSEIRVWVKHSQSRGVGELARQWVVVKDPPSPDGWSDLLLRGKWLSRVECRRRCWQRGSVGRACSCRRVVHRRGWRREGCRETTCPVRWCEYVMSCHVMCDVMCDVMSWDVMSMWCDVTRLCHEMQQNATECNRMQQNIIRGDHPWCSHDMRITTQTTTKTTHTQTTSHRTQPTTSFP